MIVNQDCQTDAQTAKAFVSSYPEWFIGLEPFDGVIEEVPVEFRSFFQKMDRCQEMSECHNGRFRCYGEVRPDDSHCMVLVTEFREFKDNEEFWEKLEAVRHVTSAHLWVMDDDTEIEHYGQYDGGGLTGESFGPNHGRPFYQVELSWRIEKLAYSQIKELALRMAAATEELWELKGVGVS